MELVAARSSAAQPGPCPRGGSSLPALPPSLRPSPAGTSASACCRGAGICLRVRLRRRGACSRCPRSGSHSRWSAPLLHTAIVKPCEALTPARIPVEDLPRVRRDRGKTSSVVHNHISQEEQDLLISLPSIHGSRMDHLGHELILMGRIDASHMNAPSSDISIYHNGQH
ncbi:hypothetical protein Y1Q_0004184 [Alligator mississippiensis]|uniref:Uncharacterized protein n=1 Tax=Alligator mississippiensis TaxID=8496 RepID=A0A151PIA6_ALLMI|nr:hypothetical protein Y1Q_0004184 [Alligator mississippiensis]